MSTPPQECEIELAGTGRAEPGSLIEAIEAAIEMAQAEMRTAT